MRGKLNDVDYTEEHHGDHPRGCGENSFRSLQRSPPSGSPPRMRGKLQHLAILQLLNRITPADAGKTTGQKATQWRLEDHPRGCGENRPLNAVEGPRRGSPPRMRGKQTDPELLLMYIRITPADAGKTLFFTEMGKQQRDHPRGCGENVKQK